MATIPFAFCLFFNEINSEHVNSILCHGHNRSCVGRAPLCVWSALDFAENPCVGRREGGARFFRHAGARWPYSCYSHVETQGIAGVGSRPTQAAGHARLVVTMVLRWIRILVTRRLVTYVLKNMREHPLDFHQNWGHKQLFLRQLVRPSLCWIRAVI